jgi:hypothetical protein
MSEPSAFEQDVRDANGISPEVLSNREIKIKLRGAVSKAKKANTTGLQYSEVFVEDSGMQTHLEEIEKLIEQIQT